MGEIRKSNAAAASLSQENAKAKFKTIVTGRTATG